MFSTIKEPTDKVFNSNIGETIKKLTNVVVWPLIILSVLAGIVMIFIGIENWRMEEFIYIGIVVAVCGPLFSLIISLILYGYGELISNTHKIAQNLEVLAENASNDKS